MRYIRTKNGIYDGYNTNKCIYVIRDKSVKESDEFRYVSYLWGNWKDYFLIDYQSCTLFSYNSAQSFISELMKENLNYQNLVIELSPYYKDCKQADTIEELCDEFVFVSSNGKKHYIDKVVYKGQLKGKSTIYGAIWTDKGLIYVAKMNNNGELMLIWAD